MGLCGLLFNGYISNNTNKIVFNACSCSLICLSNDKFEMLEKGNLSIFSEDELVSSALFTSFANGAICLKLRSHEIWWFLCVLFSVFDNRNRLRTRLLLLIEELTDSVGGGVHY